MTTRPPITIRGSTGYPRGERPPQPAATAQATAAAATSRPSIPGDDCPHRGGQVGEIDNKGCGCMGSKLTVFACALHEKCTPRRYAGMKMQDCHGCQINGLDGGLAFPEGSGIARPDPPPPPHETVLASGGFLR